ncbi:MAG: aminotransferase class I/II-fold pyridoxal phosphate-dependent enzyme [Myxococcales bacterium]|nr:aminotransferase class I/II-fold pyridoxal phosphate-dependent enzyme [Myxococcales bacterium]
MNAWTRHLRPALAGLAAYDFPNPGGAVRLDANECPEPWPPELLAELAGRVRGLALQRYPDPGGHGLRRLIAERHGVDPAQVILGNGSDEIIQLLLIALAGRPSEPSFVVLPTPTFVMYGHTARCLGVGVLEVPLTDDLQLDESVMHEALGVANGAALCFLARPNNPTSSLWDAGVIERLIAGFPGTMFVIDEAYTRYAPGTSLWRVDRPANVTFMNTLSKIGLAGLRVGWCIAPPALARAADTVRHPYNVSTVSLALAEAVLRDYPDVQQSLVDRTLVGRERLLGILRRIPGVHVFPAHANFALARLPAADDAPRLTDDLRARGILIRNMAANPRLSGCVRVSVGTSAELDRLEQALADIFPAAAS